MVMTPLSFGRKTRMSIENAYPINLEEPQFPTYTKVKEHFAKDEKKVWARFEDTMDLNQARNVMTTAMYVLGQKDKRPYGMFIRQGDMDETKRKLFTIDDGYDGQKEDMFNPGRLLKLKNNPNRFAYKADRVALYINIPEDLAAKKYGDTEMKKNKETKKMEEVGKGGWQWAWLGEKDNVATAISGFGKPKPVIFAFRERILGPPAPIKKTKGSKARMDYYDYDEWDNEDLYDEYMELVSEERALDRLLRAYGDDSDESDDDDDDSY